MVGTLVGVDVVVVVVGFGVGWGVDAVYGEGRDDEQSLPMHWKSDAPFTSRVDPEQPPLIHVREHGAFGSQLWSAFPAQDSLPSQIMDTDEAPFGSNTASVHALPPSQLSVHG